MIEVKRGCVLCDVRAEGEEVVDLRTYMKDVQYKNFPRLKK